MINHKVFGFLLALNIIGNNLFAQSDNKSIDSLYSILDVEYSTNPYLVNGASYLPNYGPHEGNPFLNRENTHSGVLYIQGIEYDNVHIEFNVYQGKVIYYYTNLYGVSSGIFLNNAYIDSFYLDGLSFHHLEAAGRDEFFNTRAKNGTLSIVSSFHKDLKLSQTSGSAPYYFTDLVEKKYLYDGKEFFSVRGLKSLKQYLGKEKYKLLLDHLNKKPDLKVASDFVLRKILLEINALDN